MDIKKEIEQIKSSAEADIGAAKTGTDIENLRVKYLGKKGPIKDVLSKLGALPPEQRGETGKLANELKNSIEALLQEKSGSLDPAAAAPAAPKVDISLPGKPYRTGFRHPIYKTMEEICAVFSKLGFSIVYGPEIETEFNNFEALNIPLQHPSRDAFDTFYVDNKNLLRSHTSPVQIRTMLKTKPPVRVIVPGKVYRPDTPDARHFYMFHQVEGLMVGEDVTFSDLKSVLSMFAQKMFGSSTKTRFRPSFFPFTEPSAEVDVSCIICNGKGVLAQAEKEKACSTCGGSGWLEILGSGMVNPKVLQNVGYDSEKYTGFAFGMGVERVAMVRYQIDDIRLFTENNYRFLRQF